MQCLLPGADLKALIEEDRNQWNHLSVHELERCAALLVRTDETRDALLALPLSTRWQVIKAFINGTSSRAVVADRRVHVVAYALINRSPAGIFSELDGIAEFARQALRAPHDAAIVNEVESADIRSAEGEQEPALRVAVTTKIRIPVAAILLLQRAKDNDAYLKVRLLKSIRTDGRE